MIRSPSRGLLFSCLLGLCSAPLVAQTVTSPFVSSNEGWHVNGFSYSGHLGGIGLGIPAPFDGSTGQPPGSLRVTDLFGETCVQAPAAFLGDKSAFYGGTLSFDILIRFTDGNDYPAAMLVGADRTLFHVLPSPPLGVWLSRSVPLTEAGWHLNGWTGPAATQADMQTVLGALQAVLINTEWKTGDDDTNVDNVVLQGTGSSWPWADLGMGLAGTHGVPVLAGSGDLTSSSAVALGLSGARENAAVGLIVGLSPLSAPFKGGVLVPFPDAVLTGFSTNASGALSIATTWPPGVPPGFVTYFQEWISDGAAPKGFAASNGLSGTAQ